jgi:hypothetical protein
MTDDKERKEKSPGPELLQRPGRPPCVNGVDVTLIRWMLSQTPRERLETLQHNIESLARLKRGTFKT